MLQRMVTKGEEEENRLYNKVREAEYARQKQEQAVKRTHVKYQQTKTKNSQDMKKKLTEVVKSEKEIEQNLLREQALLDKVMFIIKSTACLGILTWMSLAVFPIHKTKH